jgi:hypothetical protein
MGKILLNEEELQERWNVTSFEIGTLISDGILNVKDRTPYMGRVPQFTLVMGTGVSFPSYYYVLITEVERVEKMIPSLKARASATRKKNILESEEPVWPEDLPDMEKRRLVAAWLKMKKKTNREIAHELLDRGLLGQSKEENLIDYARKAAKEGKQALESFLDGQKKTY